MAIRACMTAAWWPSSSTRVGYGATKEGFDGHNYYGRYMTYPGNNFAYHVKPFEGAFTAKAASVMPTYAMPDGNITVDGITLEQVGAGFSKALLTGLAARQIRLRGRDPVRLGHHLRLRRQLPQRHGAGRGAPVSSASARRGAWKTPPRPSVT